MVGRFVKSWLARGAELLFALGLAVTFFLGFMGLLSLSFPEGTSLADLMRSGNSTVEDLRGARSGIDLRLDDPGDDDPLLAALTLVHREVKDKPVGAIAWTTSREGMRLGDQHAVQTFDRSRATITFGGESDLTLQENSLVILKSAGRTDSAARRRAALIVLDGELRGTIAVSGGSRMTVEVQAATQSASIRSAAAPGEAAEFTVRVNQDKTSTFSVFSGRADVTSTQGTRRVEPNSAITVDESGTPGPIVTLPPPPALVSPEDDARLTVRSTRARMLFAWESARETDGYRLIVARDARFLDVVNSEDLAKPEFTLGNLRGGTYYWRVSSRRGDLEGMPSAPRRFRIDRDLEEPELSVVFPGRVVETREIVLAGNADRGCRVFVNKQEVTVDATGAFKHTVELRRGVNVVVVEAIDAAGNIAYRSQTIDARY